VITDDQRRQTAATQAALRDDVDWAHQPAFDREFAKLTGADNEYVERWHDLMTSGPPRWNFTADDGSFT
jgi:hypothetical protein